MSDKKLFSDPRWNDASLPKVVGHRELTPEEKKQAEEMRKRIEARRKEKKQKTD